MLTISNPATGEKIKELETDSPSQIKDKFNRAKAAQKNWASLPARDRKEKLLTFRSLLVEQKEPLARLLTTEMGKPITQSRNEVGGVLGRIDFFIEQFELTTQNQTVFNDAGMEEGIAHEPLGVIANISAWNYPYFVGANVFVPALLTGNAVLYKPSEFATLTGLKITELLHQAGVPKDVFIPVIGGGEVGSELLNQPINGVFFTGSYATGKKIAQVASSKMIRVQLELGGKDPVYICEDVDIKSVADGVADGAFYNTGQSCCSVERIYVHEQIYDTFVDQFVKTVKGFVMGDPLDEKTYIGPLTRKPQIGLLEQQVADAKSKGARLLVGGGKVSHKNGGHYFEPTVFADTTSHMELMREESFGPIIGIQKVKSDDEALTLMNDTSYGLTAAVYSLDRARAQKILARVNAGSVYWNCCDRVSPRLPWSGRGHSGVGVTLSTAGILAFTQPKAWHLRGGK